MNFFVVFLCACVCVCVEEGSIFFLWRLLFEDVDPRTKDHLDQTRKKNDSFKRKKNECIHWCSYFGVSTAVWWWQRSTGVVFACAFFFVNFFFFSFFFYSVGLVFALPRPFPLRVCRVSFFEDGRKGRRLRWRVARVTRSTPPNTKYNPVKSSKNP